MIGESPGTERGKDQLRDQSFRQFAFSEVKGKGRRDSRDSRYVSPSFRIYRSLKTPSVTGEFSQSQNVVVSFESRFPDP